MCVAAGKLLGVEKSLAAVGEGAWRESPLRCYCLPWREGSWREAPLRCPPSERGHGSEAPLSQPSAEPRPSPRTWPRPSWRALRAGRSGAGLAWAPGFADGFQAQFRPPRFWAPSTTTEAAHARGGVGGGLFLVYGFNPPPCLGSLPSAAEPKLPLSILGGRGYWKLPFGWREALCLLLAGVLRGGVTVPATPEHAGISQPHWKEAE